MIDSSFVDAVAALAQDAQRATVLNTPCEPPGRYAIQDRDGTITFVDTPPDAQRPTFSNLDSLAGWGWTMPGRRAWVTLKGVTVTAADPRRSRGVWPLELSPQMQALLALGKAPAEWDQKTVIRQLRTTFRGCVEDRLLPIFRRVRAVKNEQGEQVFEGQRASIGKQLSAELAGTDVLPETVTFTVPVLADPFVGLATRPVLCALDADPLTVRFCFFPLPGEIEKAIRSAELELHNLVADAIARNSQDGQAAVDHDDLRAAALDQFPLYLGRPE